MEKSLLESNIIAVVFQKHHADMLEELDKIQHIDVLDQISYLAGADAKLQRGETLEGDYAKCPINILETYQVIEPVVKAVVENDSLLANEREIEEKYGLYKIKQELQDAEFEQKQEYRK